MWIRLLSYGFILFNFAMLFEFNFTTCQNIKNNKSVVYNHKYFPAQKTIRVPFDEKLEHNKKLQHIYENKTQEKLEVIVGSKKNKLKMKKGKTVSTKQRKRKGKVFLDSREDALHLRLIDDMLFKPMESNRSASIDVSDGEEITEDDIRQAVEGRDGSYVAIPAKRKKDIYKEFVRWNHLQEKNERRKKIEEEVFENYKVNVIRSSIQRVAKIHTTINPTRETIGKSNISNQRDICINNINDTECTSKKPIRTPPLYSKPQSVDTENKTAIPNKGLRKIKPTRRFNQTRNQQEFKEETVEFQYDPDFMNKLQHTMQEQRKKESKKALKNKMKREKKKQRKYITGKEDEIRPDISAEDYSALENFMLQTQKEAMGRRFYQAFANKTASDFWDNTTLETTKMLEFLLPLGKHLHKSLDKVLPNEGRHFMTNLQMYKREFEKFIALVKQDKAETRPDVVDLLEEPNEHVCETKYCEEEVKIMFGWDDKQFQEFEKLLEEVREMWYDLQLFHHCYQFVSDSTESISDSHYNCSYTDLYNNNTDNIN